MLRLMFRVFAFFLLAIAVMHAVIDATQTIGAGVLTVTSLEISWTAFSEQSLTALRSWLSGLHPFLNDVMLATLISWPTWAVFGVIALLLFMLTRHRKRRSFLRR